MASEKNEIYVATITTKYPMPEKRVYTNVTDGMIKEGAAVLYTDNKRIIIPLDNILELIFEKEQ